MLVGTVSWWVIADNGAQPPGNPTLAIIPFEVYSDDDRAGRRLRLLLADSLLARLWQVELPELELIGRAALKPYQEREDQAAAVAADLGVSLLLEGTIVRPAADQWRIDARLLAMPRGTVLWSYSVYWDEHRELPIAPTVDDLISDLTAAWPRIHADLKDSSG
jgi:TolB-like protein